MKYVKIITPITPLFLISLLLFTIHDKNFITILFTILMFSLTFFISKNYNKKIGLIFLIGIFIITLLTFCINPFTHLKLNLPIEELKVHWFFIIFFILTTIRLFFLKEDLLQIILNFINNKSSEEYSKIENFNLSIQDKKAKNIWEGLDKIFTDHYKKESSNLLKKNNLRETFSFKADKASFLYLSKLKNFSNILHTFQDAILDIIKKEKQDNSYEEIQKMLGNLIYQVKFIHYKMALTLIYKFISSVFKYFFNLLSLIVTIALFLLLINISISSDILEFVTLIQYKDLITFITGLFLFILSIPLGYTYFIALKINFLEVHISTKHDSWIVFYKNLAYYLLTFLITLLFLIFSLSLLSDSGVEYNYAFHFISTLLLPTLELQNLPSLLSTLLKDDIIFAIISIKIFFLIFIFLVSTLLIKHLMELYIELYEGSKTSRYSIPPEFASFFSYLLLSIFALVLVYGTLFINYPSLEKEYNHCQSYMTKNNKTVANCKQKNIDDTNQTRHYCQSIENLNTTNPRLLDFQQCSIGMRIETDPKSKNLNSTLTAPNPSLSDYMPLSIFLTLFGVVMMISTKNLLENYFTGLSLKINTPFEEGERIRIDGGEMLSVENIGFRATTFYGISSHAHLVIPHQKLTNSIITNYTQPTLDYRETITIYIPDRKLKNGKSIPREAEKILLLSAFISTGVKKPHLKKYCKQIKNYPKNDIKIFRSREDADKTLKELEESHSNITQDIWKELDELERKNLFFNELYKLVDKENTDNSTKKIIKKIVASIIMVIEDYQKKLDTALPYSIDAYNIKRKLSLLTKYDKHNHQELEEISTYLVNINYYYFSLAKQLWLLKSEDKSDQQKNLFDQASLELLDVPRVTSAHKRDMEGAFWEVSLLVTVELAEQSDEIVQHINMFIDELWDIFELPSRCNDE